MIDIDSLNNNLPTYFEALDSSNCNTSQSLLPSNKNAVNNNIQHNEGIPPQAMLGKSNIPNNQNIVLQDINNPVSSANNILQQPNLMPSTNVLQIPTNTVILSNQVYPSNTVMNNNIPTLPNTINTPDIIHTQTQQQPSPYNNNTIISPLTNIAMSTPPQYVVVNKNMQLQNTIMSYSNPSHPNVGSNNIGMNAHMNVIPTPNTIVNSPFPNSNNPVILTPSGVIGSNHSYSTPVFSNTGLSPSTLPNQERNSNLPLNLAMSTNNGTSVLPTPNINTSIVTNPITTNIIQTNINTNNTSIISNNTPIISNNTAVISNNTPVISNNTTVLPNNTPVIPNNTTPVISNNTPILSSNTPIISNNTPLIPSNTPIISNNTPIISNNTPLISSNAHLISNGTPIISNNTTTVLPTNNSSIISNDLSTPMEMSNTPIIMNSSIPVLTNDISTPIIPSTIFNINTKEQIVSNSNNTLVIPSDTANGVPVEAQRSTHVDELSPPIKINSMVNMVPKSYSRPLETSTSKTFLDGLTPPTKSKTLRNDYEQSYVVRSEEVPILNIGTTPTSQTNELMNSLPTPTDNYTVKCNINNDGITLDNNIKSPSQNINKSVEIMVPISPKEEISKHANGKSISSNATLVSSNASYPSPQTINKSNLLNSNTLYNNIHLLKQQPLTEEPVQFYNGNLINNQGTRKSSTMNSEKTIIVNSSSTASTSYVPSRTVTINNENNKIPVIPNSTKGTIIMNKDKNTVKQINNNKLTVPRKILNPKAVTMSEPTRFAEPISVNEPLSFTEPIIYVEPINDVDHRVKQPVRENKGKSQYINNIIKIQKSKSKNLSEILKDPSVQNRSFAFIDFLLENTGSANFLKSASRVNNINKTKNKSESKLKTFFTDGLGNEEILTLNDFLETDTLNDKINSNNNNNNNNNNSSITLQSSKPNILRASSSNQKPNTSSTSSSILSTALTNVISNNNDNNDNDNNDNNKDNKDNIKSSEQLLVKSETNELDAQSVFKAIDLNAELLKDDKESIKITDKVNSLTNFFKSLNNKSKSTPKVNSTTINLKPENKIKEIESQHKMIKENKIDQNKEQNKEKPEIEPRMEQKKELKKDQKKELKKEQKKELKKEQKKELKKEQKKELKKEQKKELKKEQKKELKKEQKKGQKKEQKKEQKNDQKKDQKNDQKNEIEKQIQIVNSETLKRKLDENVEKVVSKKRKNEEKIKEDMKSIKMEVNEIKKEAQKELNEKSTKINDEVNVQKSKKRPNDNNDISTNDKLLIPKKKKVSKESGERKRRTVKEEIEEGIMSKVKYNSNNISLYASELKTLLKYQTKEGEEVYPLRCIYEGDLEEKEYGLEDLICTFPDCNKVFSKSIHLEKHFAEHGEDFRPFQCPNCTKNFRRRYDLMRHSRIHNYIIPYRCSRCLRGFTRSDSCARHTKTRQCKYYDFTTIEMKKSHPPYYTIIKDPVAKSENKIIIVPLTKEKN